MKQQDFSAIWGTLMLQEATLQKIAYHDYISMSKHFLVGYEYYRKQLDAIWGYLDVA